MQDAVDNAFLDFTGSPVCPCDINPSLGSTDQTSWSQNDNLVRVVTILVCTLINLPLHLTVLVPSWMGLFYNQRTVSLKKFPFYCSKNSWPPSFCYLYLLRIVCKLQKVLGISSVQIMDCHNCSVNHSSHVTKLYLYWNIALRIRHT